MMVPSPPPTRIASASEATAASSARHSAATLGHRHPRLGPGLGQELLQPRRDRSGVRPSSAPAAAVQHQRHAHGLSHRAVPVVPPSQVQAVLGMEPPGIGQLPTMVTQR